LIDKKSGANKMSAQLVVRQQGLNIKLVRTGWNRLAICQDCMGLPQRQDVDRPLYKITIGSYWP
jgi:hypothetical protein